MRRPLHCPQCKNVAVLRARPRSPREHVAALLFVSPFQCPSCSHRFLASRLGLNRPQHSFERREHLRIPVRLYLSFSGGKVRGEGTVMDLSVGGCIIKSETQVHADDIFYLQLTLDETEPPLEVAAMVRSVSTRGIAFKFLRAAQENKRLMTFVQAQTAGHPDKTPLHLSMAS